MCKLEIKFSCEVVGLSFIYKKSVLKLRSADLQRGQRKDFGGFADQAMDRLVQKQNVSIIRVLLTALFFNEVSTAE